jgi:hypothetical protein
VPIEPEANRHVPALDAVLDRDVDFRFLTRLFLASLPPSHWIPFLRPEICWERTETSLVVLAEPVSSLIARNGRGPCFLRELLRPSSGVLLLQA